jgi:hypothetical protein
MGRLMTAGGGVRSFVGLARATTKCIPRQKKIVFLAVLGTLQAKTLSS